MIQHFIDDFFDFATLQLPQLISTEWMEEPKYYEDYALLVFNPSKSYTLENTMDMLEDQMVLIPLYHMIPSNATTFGHCYCAFSNPSFGHMYKFNVMTDGNGLINQVAVTVYESMEFMAGDLCNDLELHSKTGYFKYRRPKYDILKYFI
jgi:hypothetical protein